MKDQLVSGLNDWLLNADADDRRYSAMEALRDTLEGADEESAIIATVEEYASMPRPVAQGFQFDLELNDQQSSDLKFLAENTEGAEYSVQLAKLMNKFINDGAKVTWSATGLPTHDDNPDN